MIDGPLGFLLASLPIGALVDRFGAQAVVAVFGALVTLVLSPVRLMRRAIAATG